MESYSIGYASYGAREILVYFIITTMSGKNTEDAHQSRLIFFIFILGYFILEYYRLQHWSMLAHHLLHILYFGNVSNLGKKCMEG